MLTVGKLKEYGADVEKGLSRCANNESLYLRLVKICIQEISADALGAALKEGDLRSKTPGDYEKLHGDILKETAVIASLMN